MGKQALCICDNEGADWVNRMILVFVVHIWHKRFSHEEAQASLNARWIKVSNTV